MLKGELALYHIAQVATEQAACVIGFVQPKQPIDEDRLRGFDLGFVLGAVLGRNEVSSCVFKVFEGIELLRVRQVAIVRRLVAVNQFSSRADHVQHSINERAEQYPFDLLEGSALKAPLFDVRHPQ